VGAMDSIIDIVGASIAIKSLSIDKVISSPIALGSGWTDTMHGRLPIPAPATLEILKGVPVSSSSIPFELTTPTGAAIVKTLAIGFGPMPSMTIENTGYGAGKKDFREAANVLRAIKGAVEKTGNQEAEALLMLEANIDDMSPQTAGYLMERLFEGGALDVYFTPVVMKKSRPGILLSALTPFNRRDALLSTIFAESTTIGVRLYPIERVCLERKIIKVKTRYGPIRVKVSLRDNKAVNIQPEYEDIRAAAIRHGVPLKTVMHEARSAASAGAPVSLYPID
ncbi:MAG: nickel pincer cofactor biosynthesis protein LarC, partial [Deltaproteobacteria bacterium]